MKFQETWRRRVIWSWPSAPQRNDQVLMARIGSVIKRLIAQWCGRRTPTPPPIYIDLRQPDQPSETNTLHSNAPPIIPESTQRAGPSGTNHPDLKARRAQIDYE